MLRVTTILPALLAVSACAGEAGGSALSLMIPDAAATAKRLGAGPFAAVWQSPEVQRWVALLPGEGGVDAAWLGVIGRARQARIDLTMAPWHGGLPTICLRGGVLLPEGQDPGGAVGLRSQRANAWWLVGVGEPRPALPGETAIAGSRGTEDLVATADLLPWAHLLPPSQQPLAREILAVLGVRRMEVLAHAEASGMVDHVSLPGAKIPLKALDPAVLAGFPERPLAMLAFAVDGAALKACVASVVKDVEGAGAAIEDGMGHSAAELAAASDGTIVIAVEPGSPLPGVVVSIPATPLSDAMIQAAIEQRQPGEGAALMAAAAEQPVPVAMPGATPLQIRRSAGRWLFAHDASRLQILASDQPPAFPVASMWPEAETPQALLWIDWAACAPLVAATLPREQAALATALRTGGTHLPPTALAIAADGHGLLAKGRNGCGLLAPLGAVAVPLLPKLVGLYRQAAMHEITARMSGILTRAQLFSKATSEHWPRDFDDLRSWAKDMSPDMFTNAGQPGIRDPFCYVQPRPLSPAEQPVLVQDPACNDGTGSLVGFVDGRVVFMPSVLYWSEAKRLSALPEARADGIDASAWATMPKLF